MSGQDGGLVRLDVGHQLERRFVVAMLLVAAIAAADLLVVEYHTAIASRDAEITNLAGRQRMLAGRVASLVSRLDAPDAQGELAEAVDRMREGLRRLTEPGGGYLDAPEVRRLCLDGDGAVRPRLMAYLAAAEHGDARAVAAMHGPLVADIDRSVTAYAAFAAQRITVLRGIEAAGFAAQLLALWLTWRLLFRPMARRIEHDFTALAASRARTRTILDTAGEGICGIDRAGRVTFINDAACRMLGRDRAAALGADLHALAHHHHADGNPVAPEECGVILANQSGSAQRILLDALWRQDGSHFPAEVTVAPLRGQGGLFGAVIVFSDITERLQAESGRALADNVFNTITEGVFVTTPDGLIARVNPAFSVITGYQPEEAIGQTPRILKSGRHGADEYRAMWDAIATQGSWQGEIWNRRRNGEVFCASQSIAALRDGRGNVTHYVAVFKDVTDYRTSEEAIRRQAYQDQLTGLPNRSLFMDRFKLAIAQARRNERQLAVMFVDLDRFKQINDSLGHAAGDAVLCEAGRRLRAVLRDSDTVARLGGDEFIVLLSDLSEPADAAKVAEKMLQRMALPIDLPELPEQPALIGASIGIALFPRNGDTVDKLVQVADAAMYAVKAQGRNGYRFA